MVSLYATKIILYNSRGGVFGEEISKPDDGHYRPKHVVF